MSLNFAIEPMSSTSSDFTPFFTCSEFDGSLAPQESKKIKLLYSPYLPSLQPSIDYFNVHAIGGLGKTCVVCIGMPVMPKVAIEKNIVDFGNVELGKSVTRTLHISNESACSTIYQVGNDQLAIFFLLLSIFV